MRNRVWLYMRIRKLLKVIILLMCCSVAVAFLLFILTDFKIYLAIRFKLLISMNPFVEHISSIEITDTNISVVRAFNPGTSDNEERFQISAKTTAELNAFLYELSKNDFWNINRSVYLESGAPDVLLGSDPPGHITAGIGFGIDVTEDTRETNGTWMYFEFYHSEEDKKAFMEILEEYNFQKGYCPN